MSYLDIIEYKGRNIYVHLDKKETMWKAEMYRFVNDTDNFGGLESSDTTKLGAIKKIKEKYDEFLSGKNVNETGFLDGMQLAFSGMNFGAKPQNWTHIAPNDEKEKSQTKLEKLTSHIRKKIKDIK